jgi:HK97 family phage portal protein
MVKIVVGAPEYTLTHLNGQQTRHGPDEIIHARLPLTADGITGLSPLRQCAEAIGLNRALAEEASATAVNASVPLGVLTVQAGPGVDDALENLRAGFEARHQGPKQRGRIGVVSGDIKYQAVSLSAHDSELVERQKLSTMEIARLFLPSCPWAVNAPSNDSLTYSNSETQAMALIKYVISIYTTSLEQAITNSPLCAGPFVFVEFLYDSILRADSLVRSQVYTAALGNPQTGAPGWMTRAEVRQRENLPDEAQPTVSEAA